MADKLRRSARSGDVPVEWWSPGSGRPPRLDRDLASAAEVVFHAAGAYPHGAANLAQEINAAESQVRTVLQAFDAAGAGRLVYTSSFTTLGPPNAAGAPGR
ncbi:MAG: hypothetical protein IPM84_15650 [Anaerolineae bacterium]|nr:hypothetical protein [Anaerolineae bacterium]